MLTIKELIKQVLSYKIKLLYIVFLEPYQFPSINELYILHPPLNTRISAIKHVSCMIISINKIKHYRYFFNVT